MKKAFFPLFVDMTGRKVLVIGGGNVAERRIKTLTGFGAKITVISPAVTGHIEHAASSGLVRLVKRKYKKGDIAALMPVLVIAAADERQANKKAKTEAGSLGILVSVADCRDECTFIFPAIAESGDYIAGIISKNGSHSGVKKTAKKVRGLLDP